MIVHAVSVVPVELVTQVMVEVINKGWDTSKYYVTLLTKDPHTTPINEYFGESYIVTVDVNCRSMDDIRVGVEQYLKDHPTVWEKFEELKRSVQEIVKKSHLTLLPWEHAEITLKERGNDGVQG